MKTQVRKNRTKQIWNKIKAIKNSIIVNYLYQSQELPKTCNFNRL